MNSYIGDGGIDGGVELGGNCEKCCNVESIGGTKPFMNVNSHVLGLVWCLVWPHCADVYHEVSKILQFQKLYWSLGS